MRHIRKHVGFIEALRTFYAHQIHAVSTAAVLPMQILMQLMDIIDGMDASSIHTFGYLLRDDMVLHKCPVDLNEAQYPQWRLAQEVATYVFHMAKFDGICCGTELRRFHGIAYAEYGLLVIWLRSDRTKYQTYEVKPAHMTHIEKYREDWLQCSSMLLYTFASSEADVPEDGPLPRLEDISAIPFMPDYDSDDMNFSSNTQKPPHQGPPPAQRPPSSQRPPAQQPPPSQTPLAQQPPSSQTPSTQRPSSQTPAQPQVKSYPAQPQLSSYPPPTSTSMDAGASMATLPGHDFHPPLLLLLLRGCQRRRFRLHRHPSCSLLSTLRWTTQDHVQ